jgi:hypothetical protein
VNQYLPTATLNAHELTPVCRCSIKVLPNRDRAAPREAAPLTPPTIRVRSGRFGCYRYKCTVPRVGSPRELSTLAGSACWTAGLLLNRQEPLPDLVVTQAVYARTPLRLSSRYRALPHCFQIRHRSFLLIHESSNLKSRDTIGISAS